MGAAKGWSSMKEIRPVSRQEREAGRRWRMRKRKRQKWTEVIGVGRAKAVDRAGQRSSRDLLFAAGRDAPEHCNCF
jgi:hypothetical protein